VLLAYQQADHVRQHLKCVVDEEGREEGPAPPLGPQARVENLHH
jgi:hypothetical protein